MTQLVIARGVQGLGAGALMPLAIATIGDLVPPSDRGRWQGLTGAVFGVASILGPTTGGYIAGNADWRWVFLVSLPVALIALIVVAATLKIPPHPERATKLDYTGAALLAGGLSAALLGLVRGGQEAPWGSAQVLGLIGAGAVLLAIFLSSRCAARSATTSPAPRSRAPIPNASAWSQLERSALHWPDYRSPELLIVEPKPV